MNELKEIYRELHEDFQFQQMPLYQRVLVDIIAPFAYICGRVVTRIEIIKDRYFGGR